MLCFHRPILIQGSGGAKTRTPRLADDDPNLESSFSRLNYSTDHHDILHILTWSGLEKRTNSRFIQRKEIDKIYINPINFEILEIGIFLYSLNKNCLTK